MPEGENIFRPLEPASPEVSLFIKEHPEAQWDACLSFLMKSFPQKNGGEIRYVIDGGAAIRLLVGEERRMPKDIDIITLDQTLADALQNSRYFDVKMAKAWFEVRGLTYQEKLGEILMQQHVPVSFDGQEVYVLRPEWLATSKAGSYAGRMPREDDVKDIDLLGVSPESIKEVFASLR